MKIDWIEFNDPDDPRSGAYPDKKESGSFRITFAPEGMAVLLPNAKHLSNDDRMVLAQMLKLAYTQGKEVGKKTNR